MTPPVTLAVLIAAHNRKGKTLACLESVMAQNMSVALRIIVFDDGSTDGTATAVRTACPAVEILKGDGTAFWSGGMRAAFDHALRTGADFYLWLNDDVELAPDAVRRLLATDDALERDGHQLRLIGGAVANPQGGRTSYGGIVQASRRRPLRFRRICPDPRIPLVCDTLVGNVVLVPQRTARAVGSIDPAFRHTLGDLDYGLRVKSAGGWVGIASGHVGWCAPNTAANRWFNPRMGLAARWRLVGDPLGFPFRPWLQFARRHGGGLWPAFVLLPYWRLLVPAAVASLVDACRTPTSHSKDGRVHAAAG